MHTTYLLLGSNMGDSKRQLQKAIAAIRKNIGRVVRRSALYLTAAWGKTDQPDFLNQVIVVHTRLDAQQTMRNLLAIEKTMGRVRTTPNAPRTIDIDILFFDKEIITGKDLTIPHPRIAERRFVLTPLNELAPNFKHPALNRSIHDLFIHCPDTLNVKKF